MERAVQEMSQLRQEIAQFMAQYEQGMPLLLHMPLAHQDAVREQLPCKFSPLQHVIRL